MPIVVFDPGFVVLAVTTLVLALIVENGSGLCAG
jgi:hypothetical protein